VVSRQRINKNSAGIIPRRCRLQTAADQLLIADG